MPRSTPGKPARAGTSPRPVAGIRGVLDVLSGQASLKQVPDKAFRSHLERARAICESGNIVGMGICEKEIRGRRSGSLAVCFYVKTKCSPADMTGANFLPPVLGLSERRSVLTDVIELGEPRLDATTTPAALVQSAPIRSGFSISHFADTAGTLAAIVRHKGKLHVLSNAHVLALSGRAKKGDPILYPGRQDGGTPIHAIARLTASSVIKDGQAAVDAAIAELLPQALDDVDFSIHGARTPLRIAAPRRNMQIVKMGKQSGVTQGVVRDVDFSVTLPYPHLGRLVQLHGQVRCTTYSVGGDSGALVVEKQTGAVVGLHLGSANGASFFTPIGAVLSALSITL